MKDMEQDKEVIKLPHGVKEVSKDNDLTLLSNGRSYNTKYYELVFSEKPSKTTPRKSSKSNGSKNNKRFCDLPREVREKEADRLAKEMNAKKTGVSKSKKGKQQDLTSRPQMETSFKTMDKTTQKDFTAWCIINSK